VIVGANVASVRLAVSGDTDWFAVADTVGANVVSESDAVSGTTV
jgi:hypothetical protein